MKASVIVMMVLFPLCLKAQGNMDRLTPKWMGGQNGPSFRVVRTDNPESAAALGKLVEVLGTEWNVGQSIELQSIDVLERTNGRLSGGKQTQVSRLDIVADGKPVSIECQLVDTWTHAHGGRYEYCSLYQVADMDSPFIPCHVTNQYGITPLFMSIIPGLGQFYKGDPLKGSLFLGGCALGIGGTIFLESQRQATITQRSQTHDINLIKQYSADERNLSTARNVTIGVTLALYVYNLIDAAVAPGSRKLVLDQGGIHYSF